MRRLLHRSCRLARPADLAPHLPPPGSLLPPGNSPRRFKAWTDDRPRYEPVRAPPRPARSTPDDVAQMQGDDKIMSDLRSCCGYFRGRLRPEAAEAFAPLFAAIDGPSRGARDAAIAALERVSHRMRSWQLSGDAYARNLLISALAQCPPRSGELTEAMRAMETFVAELGIRRLNVAAASAYVRALVNRAEVIRGRLRYLTGHVRRRYSIGRARALHTIGRRFGVDHSTKRDASSKVLLETEIARLQQEHPVDAIERFVEQALPAGKLQPWILSMLRRRGAFSGRFKLIDRINAHLAPEQSQVDAMFCSAVAHDRAGNHAQVLAIWQRACEEPYPMAAASRAEAADSPPFAPTLRSRLEMGVVENETWLNRRPTAVLGDSASLANMAVRAAFALGREDAADRMAKRPPVWLIDNVGESVSVQLQMTMAFCFASRQSYKRALERHNQAYDDAEAMLAGMDAQSTEHKALLDLLSVSTRSLLYHIDQGDDIGNSPETSSDIGADIRVVVDALVAVKQRLLMSPGVPYRLAEINLIVVRAIRARMC